MMEKKGPFQEIEIQQPKELSEFIGLRKTKFGYAPMPIISAPQSWQYVEEATEND